MHNIVINDNTNVDHLALITSSASMSSTKIIHFKCERLSRVYTKYVHMYILYMIIIGSPLSLQNNQKPDNHSINIDVAAYI